MKLLKVIRYLAVADILLYVLWWYSPVVSVQLYDEQALSLMQWANYGSSFDVTGPVPYLIALSQLIVMMGIITVRTWAPIAFYVLVIFGLSTSFLWGISMSGPVDGTIAYLWTMVDNAILALLLFTDVSKAFRDPYEQLADVVEDQ